MGVGIAWYGATNVALAVVADDPTTFGGALYLLAGLAIFAIGWQFLIGRDGLPPADPDRLLPPRWTWIPTAVGLGISATINTAVLAGLIDL